LNAVNAFEVITEADQSVRQEALGTAVLLLSPIVPHVTHELWHALGHTTAVIDERWPTVDQQALVKDEVQFVVQVNGKLRARLTMAAGVDRDAVEAMALADPNVQQFIEGKAIRKVIVVPNKLINLVV